MDSMGNLIPFGEERIKMMDKNAISSSRGRERQVVSFAAIKHGQKIINAKVDKVKQYWTEDLQYFSDKKKHLSDRDELKKMDARQYEFRHFTASLSRLQLKVISELAHALGYADRTEYIDYLIRKDLSERGIYNVSDDRIDIVTSGLNTVHDAYWWLVKQESRTMWIATEVLYGHKYKPKQKAFYGNQPNIKYAQYALAHYNRYKDRLKLYEDMEEYANERLKEGWAGGIQHAKGMINNIRVDRKRNYRHDETNSESYIKNLPAIEEYRRNKKAAAQRVADSQSVGAEHSGE